MRILITGMSGFAGSYLAEELIKDDTYTVSGTYLSDESLKNLEKIASSVSLHKLNLLESAQFEKLLLETRPDVVFHLAAFASPAESFKNPKAFFSNNIEPEITLLENVRKNNLHTKIILITSAEIYGKVKPEDLPIDEKASMQPTSPYSVSKIAQDYLGLQYHLSYGMDIIRVRPFNHIGPRQADGFVVSSFAKRIVELENNPDLHEMKVGNLEAKRDFTDVRDVVRAYRMIMEKGVSGEAYNVGSGTSHKIEEVLTFFKSEAKRDFAVVQDPNLMRPSDIPEIVSDCSKLKSQTGWEAQIPFEQSLKDTLDYWRNISYN